MKLLPQRDIDLRSVGGLIFNEEDHSYHNADGIRYTGVTTLLSKYKLGFDSDAMSKYKSLKDFLPEDKFAQLKKHAGGWENVYKFYEKVCSKSEEYQIGLEKIKTAYLTEWDLAGKTGSEDGSLEHDLREKDVMENGFLFKGKHYPYSNKNITEITDKDCCVCTELLLWDHNNKIAGLADIVVFDNGVFHILDFKTNKKIGKYGFNGAKLLSPFSDLPECEYSIYTLQLNIYSYMIEKLSQLKKGESWLINTASVKHNRSEDIYIECDDMRDRVKESIFNELF